MRISIPLKWQLLVLAVIHVLIFTVLFDSGIYGIRYSAVGLFYDFASRTVNGDLPYRDFVLEYPPLALLFFVLPRLLATSFQVYAVAFTVEIILFDLLGLLLIALISRRLNQSSFAGLTVYTIALISIGPLIVDRYDLIPGILTLLAIYAICHGKQKTAWAVLAVGTMTKLYPAILAPLFLLHNVYQKQYRRLPGNLATYAAISLIVAVPFVLLAGARFWDSFAYHFQRGLQLESTYSSILLLGWRLGSAAPELQFAFGGWNLASPAAATLSQLSPFFLLVFLALVYWRYYPVQKATAGQETSHLGLTSMINSSFLAILAFLITGKVLSPQFIIWLFPLVPVVTGRARCWTWGAFIPIALMTYYIFPTHYLQLVDLNQTVVSILILRNALLVALFFLLFPLFRTARSVSKHL
ncbi:MAG: hypothetical protein HYX81_03565 [Chloroflexi bacterium]|nr:hypothetical protein [Chloroflexota bacterium]